MSAFLCVLFMSSVGAVSAENILILLPMPFYSHTNTFMPVFKELASRAHNITMVSPFPQKKRIGNWTDIIVKKEPLVKAQDTMIGWMANKNIFFFYLPFWRLCNGLLEVALQDEAIKELIKSENLKFDLVITEAFLAHEALAAFAHKLNVPLVGITPFTMSPYTCYATGNLMFRADIPNFRTPHTSRMTFIQRMVNTVIDLLELSTAYFYYLPMQEKLAEKYMIYPGSENRPPIVELLKNITLLLTDSHRSVGYPRPLQPNVIEVGGLTMNTSTELPEDLKLYLDNSRNGFLYLNFGTFLPLWSVGEKAINTILSTFGKLNVNVLLKWEIGKLKDIPPNVFVREWFPQAGILAHPKCLVFVTHGGIHGLNEASFHGVPVVGMPFYNDQEFNLRFAEEKGFGYLLPRASEITEEQFHLALATVIGNKSVQL